MPQKAIELGCEESHIVLYAKGVYQRTGNGPVYDLKTMLSVLHGEPFENFTYERVYEQVADTFFDVSDVYRSEAREFFVGVSTLSLGNACKTRSEFLRACTELLLPFLSQISIVGFDDEEGEGAFSSCGPNCLSEAVEEVLPRIPKDLRKPFDALRMVSHDDAFAGKSIGIGVLEYFRQHGGV